MNKKKTITVTINGETGCGKTVLAGVISNMLLSNTNYKVLPIKPDFEDNIIKRMCAISHRMLGPRQVQIVVGNINKTSFIKNLIKKENFRERNMDKTIETICGDLADAILANNDYHHIKELLLQFASALTMPVNETHRHGGYSTSEIVMKDFPD